MTETIDFPKMRKELILLYEEFLKKPEDESIQKKAIGYDRHFGGLSSYNDYLKSQPIPKDIETALGGLSTIYQYGEWDESHEAFSKTKILETAQKILKGLKKFK